MPDIGLFASPVGIISGHSQIGRGKITVVKYADPEITFNQISERQAGTETEIAGFTEGPPSAAAILRAPTTIRKRRFQSPDYHYVPKGRSAFPCTILPCATCRSAASPGAEAVC